MITVYGKPGCPNCDQAKSLLGSRNIEFQYIEIDQGQTQDPNKTYISRAYFLELFPQVRSLPHIVNDNTVIGGFKELVQHIKGN